MAGRQGRRARRNGADHRSRNQQGQRRPHGQGLSRQVALQAEGTVDGHGQGAARHLGLPARLRQRQAPAVQLDADAGPRQEPRPRRAPQRFALHGRHQEDHQRCRCGRPFRRLAGRRLRLEEELHPRPRDHERAGDPRRRTGFRAYAGRCRRFDLFDAELGNLHSHADRRPRCRQHQFGQFRLVSHLRTGQVPDGTRGLRALVHVRADPDVEEGFRQAQRRAESSRHGGRQEGPGLRLRCRQGAR